MVASPFPTDGEKLNVGLVGSSGGHLAHLLILNFQFRSIWQAQQTRQKSLPLSILFWICAIR